MRLEKPREKISGINRLGIRSRILFAVSATKMNYFRTLCDFVDLSSNELFFEISHFN